jgi:hypothetical protein
MPMVAQPERIGRGATVLALMHLDFRNPASYSVGCAGIPAPYNRGMNRTDDDERHDGESAGQPAMARESISARPESRFAVVTGVIGGLSATAISVKGILGSASSTAAIGFLLVPFIAAAAMALAGVWGLALGTVWYSLRGAKRYFRAVLLMAWVVALSIPGVAGWKVWEGFALERAVAATRAMSAADLERAIEQSSWRDNRFYVGALAQNKAAAPALLDRIAKLPIADLTEPLGSLWDVQGDNRKGLSALRLVARHPNVSPATLEYLAGMPRAQELAVLSDVLRNARTPMAIVMRHVDSADELLQADLALNPNLPPAVMERLARSPNLYVRMNLTWNEATPAGLLEALARDADAIVVRNASQALERRARRSAGVAAPAAGP